MAEFRAVQPMMWAGMIKRDGGPMVCGACPTPELCDAEDRCARASDEDYMRHLWTTDEREAVEHVKRQVRVDGSHSTSGCPRYSRMMCGYRRTIKSMKDRNIWPTDLGDE